MSREELWGSDRFPPRSEMRRYKMEASHPALGLCHKSYTMLLILLTDCFLPPTDVVAEYFLFSFLFGMWSPVRCSAILATNTDEHVLSLYKSNSPPAVSSSFFDAISRTLPTFYIERLGSDKIVPSLSIRRAQPFLIVHVCCMRDGVHKCGLRVES